MRKGYLGIANCLIVLCLAGLLSAGSFVMAAPRVIRAADDAAYPPQIMLNDKGEVDGLEADLIRALELETGYRVEWSLGSWDDAVQKLRNSQVDIIPGMNVTEERKREFGFTRPYFEDRVVLFIPVDSFHIVGLADLQNRRVGIQKGEVAGQLLRKAKPELNYYEFNSQRELLQAVAERTVDAAAANYYVGKYWLRRAVMEDQIKTNGESIFVNPFAIAVGKDDPELLIVLDQALGRIQARGELQRIKNKWLGEEQTFWGLARKQLVTYVLAGLAALGLVLLAGLSFIHWLQRKIRTATVTIADQNMELQAAYEQLTAQNEELIAQGEELTLGEARAKALLQAVPDMILRISRTGIYKEIIIPQDVPAYNSPQMNIGQSIYDTISRELADRFIRNIEMALSTRTMQILEYETELEGSRVYCESRVMSLGNDEVMIVVRDITEARKREDRIIQLAYSDVLTGLANRAKFLAELEIELAEVGPGNNFGSVLFLNIDNFKEINDSFGHACGDALLIEVGKRLNQVILSPHVLARLGGDEFVILLKKEHQVEELAETLLQLFGLCFEQCGQRFILTSSIGIARYPKNGIFPGDLMRCADTAMHTVKRTGKNAWQHYDSIMHETALRKLRLEHDLRQALQKRQFSLYYQPIVDAGSQKVRGLEALLRWNSPEHGSVSPVEFIPLAEGNGLIVPIGEWVLRTACEFACRLRLGGCMNLFVSVNLSARQLARDEFTDQVRRILADTQLPADTLKLEITESSLVENYEVSNRKLLELRGLGVQFALDDFGTGYSSLTYLKHLPIQLVKIDKSFVDDVTGGKMSVAILGTIINLAHQLGLTVVAEGVETEQQLKILLEQNCDMIQGYWISKPLPEAKLIQWLAIQS